MNNKIYKCELCNSHFNNHGSYWAHKNKKKTACISQEKCLEIVDKIQLQTNELDKTKQENEKTKQENEKLKEILNKLSQNDSKIEQLITKIGDDKTYIKESISTLLSSVDKVQETIETNQTAHQLTQINNTMNNNADNKMCFDIHFTENNKEKLSHISQEMMLKILNHKDFNDTLKHIAKTVFFHPEAPQNWKWCVTDKKAAEGALEYNAESNTVIRKSTGEVINFNMQNIIFQISDFLTNLKKNKCEFNATQTRNREKIYDTLGNDFTSEQINCIKGAGYDGRNLAKALWESLYITVESTPISRIKTKVKIV